MHKSTTGSEKSWMMSGVVIPSPQETTIPPSGEVPTLKPGEMTSVTPFRAEQQENHADWNKHNWCREKHSCSLHAQLNPIKAIVQLCSSIGQQQLSDYTWQGENRVLSCCGSTRESENPTQSWRFLISKNIPQWCSLFAMNEQRT